MEKNIEAAIAALEDFYAEHVGANKSIEYAYGFFDALAVLREMKERAG
jgi:hypothetical protein